MDKETAIVMAHRINGYVEGQTAQLHRGVGGGAPVGLLGP